MFAQPPTSKATLAAETRKPALRQLRCREMGFWSNRVFWNSRGKQV